MPYWYTCELFSHCFSQLLIRSWKNVTVSAFKLLLKSSWHIKLQKQLNRVFSTTFSLWIHVCQVLVIEWWFLFYIQIYSSVSLTLNNICHSLCIPLYGGNSIIGGSCRVLRCHAVIWRRWHWSYGGCWRHLICCFDKGLCLRGSADLSPVASGSYNDVRQCTAYTDKEQRADYDPNYGPSTKSAVGTVTTRIEPVTVHTIVYTAPVWTLVFVGKTITLVERCENDVKVIVVGSISVEVTKGNISAAASKISCWLFLTASFVQTMH